MARYILDNAWQQARQRLAALEAAYDPGTIRHLRALGVDAGWRCLEVGGGGGSIAAWLCAAVGAGGSVLATDIDTRFLAAIDAPNLAVREHNLVTDPLPEAAFDLVHTRAVLAHLPERAEALRKLIGALAPGGWLLVEEPDFVSQAPVAAASAAELFDKHAAALARISAAAGADIYFGRQLLPLLIGHGLTEVGAEGRVPMARGGSPDAERKRLGTLQLREALMATGLLAADDLDTFLALLADPSFFWTEAMVMAAWGRRPAA